MAANQKQTLSVILTDEDERRLTVYMFRRFAGAWRYHAYWLSIGALVILVNLIVLRFLISLPLPVAGLFLVFWPAFYFWRGAERYAQHKQQEFIAAGQSSAGLHTFCVDTRGFTNRVEGDEATCDWSQVRRIDSTSEHTFIEFSDGSGCVIPRHSVQSGDYEAFVHASKQCWQAYRTRPSVEHNAG